MALGPNEVLIDDEVREIDYFIESTDKYIQNKSPYTAWYEPGTILAFRNGERPQIRFIDLKGTDTDRIIICNKGKVEINSSSSYGLSFFGGENLRILGNTDPDIPETHGIYIKKTGSGAPGVDFRSRSEKIEIGHVEVSNTGFCGIMAKTDGAIGWTMNDVEIHHMYIHDTHGEGMYIGETKTPSHEIKNLQVHHNLILRTGWDLFQVANCTEDIKVYNNTMWDGGIQNVSPQNKGIQIGDWSTGNYYNNVVGKTRSNFLINMGSYDIDIYNSYYDGDNVLPHSGVFSDERSMSVEDSIITYRDNWFRDYNDTLFLMYNNVNKSVIKDNIYNPTRGGVEFIRYGGGASSNNVEMSGNVEENIPRIEFVNEGNDDYRIVPNSYYSGKNLGYEETDAPPVEDPPPVPINLVATPQSESSIQLNWQNTDGPYSDEWGVKIDRSTTANSGYNQIYQSDVTEGGITEYLDTGLETNTTYYYKVRNYNDAGNSLYSNVASATTSEVTEPPEAPSNLVATGVTESQINLSWQDNSDDETGFVIERQDGTTWTAIGSVGADNEFFSDTGLTESTSYTYRVKAVSFIEDSNYSNEAVGTTNDEPGGDGGVVTIKFVYGNNNVYKGDVKGAVGQVEVEEGEQVINNLVITNIVFVSSSSSLTDAQNTAQAQKLQNPDKFVWIDPEPIETQLVEIS